MGEPSRIVGILGGMGPAATADFYDRLIRATPARHDQDHLRVVIWSDPTVPNRHEALIGDGTDPTPWLEHGVRQLRQCGAEIVVAPCNTVHAFLPTIMADKDVEFLSIIDTMVDEVAAAGTGDRVGLLAADGALASGLYQSALRAAGKQTVLPADRSQQALMRTIYRVKSGSAGSREAEQLSSVLDELEAAGAHSVIIGCTELSVLSGDVRSGVHLMDAADALVRRTVAAAARAR
ncbi:MAG: aspartate/glutamate racemase family protein [Nocardioidaceae bacterium]